MVTASTMGGERGDRVFAVVFGLAMVALLVPLWGIDIIPLQDLGGHIELMDAVARYGEPGTQYAEVFELPRWGGPNTLSLAAAKVLGPVIGVDAVARLLLTFYVWGLPLAFVFLLRTFGRSRWLVFLSVPSVYGALMNQGFINFLMAFPLLLLVIPLARLWAEGGERKHGLALAGTYLLAFFSHVMVFMILVGMGLAVMLVYTRNLRALWRLCVLVPALPFFGLWTYGMFVEQKATAAGRTFTDKDGGLGLVYNDIGEHIVEMPNWWMVFFKDKSDWVPMGLGLAVWFGLMVVFRAKTERESPVAGEWTRVQAWLQRYLLEVVTVCCIAAFFALPSHMNEMALIAERVVLLFMLLLMAWPRHDFSTRGAQAMLVPGIAMAIAWPAWVTYEFYRFDEGFGELPEAIAELPDGTRLFFEMRDIRDPIGLRGSAWHIHKGLHALSNGGTTNDTFAIRPYTPVQLKPGETPWYYSAWHLENETLSRYAGVLIRSDAPPSDLMGMSNMEVLYASSPWWLFRRHTPELAEGMVVTAGPDHGVPVAWDCEAKSWVAGLVVAGGGAISDVQLICKSDTGNRTRQMGFSVPGYQSETRCRMGERVVGLSGELEPKSRTLQKVGVVCENTAIRERRALAPVGDSSGAEAFRVECPEGSFARGFRGRQSTPWHQLGLLCQPDP